MKSLVELQKYYNDLFEELNFKNINKKFINISSKYSNIVEEENILKGKTIQDGIDYIKNKDNAEDYIWVILLDNEVYSGFSLINLFATNKKYNIIFLGKGAKSIVKFNYSPTIENGSYSSNKESNIFYVNFLWENTSASTVNFHYLLYNAYFYNMIFLKCVGVYGYFLKYDSRLHVINNSFKECGTFFRIDSTPTEPIIYWNNYGTIGQGYSERGLDKDTDSITNTDTISFDDNYNIMEKKYKKDYGSLNNNIFFNTIFNIKKIKNSLNDNFDLNNNYNRLNINYISKNIEILLNDRIIHIENTEEFENKNIILDIKKYIPKDTDINILKINDIFSKNEYIIKKYNKFDKEFIKDLRLFKNDSMSNLYVNNTDGIYIKPDDESITKGSFIFDVPTDGHSNISAISSNLDKKLENVGLLFNFDNNGFKYLEEGIWKDELVDESKYIPISRLNEITDESFKLLLGDKYLFEGSLKVKVILENKDVYITNITILYSEDVLPKIKNPSITLSEVHKEDTQLSFSVEDIDGDTCEYKLAVYNQLTRKNILIENWKELSLKYKEDDIAILISNKYFTTGKNVLFLEIKDERNNIVKWNGIITRNNQFPEINMIYDNFNLNATISDAESDKITFQLEINNRIIFPYAKFITDYITPPYNFKYTFREEDKLIKGGINNVIFKVKDDLGEEKVLPLEIVGQDNGLVVLDMNDKYYSDAYGKVKKKMDLETLYIPMQTDILSFKIRNNSKYTLKDIVIKGDTSKLENEVLVNLNFSDTPFTPHNQLTISQMEPNDERMVFFKLTINKRVTVIKNELPIRISGTIIPN